MAKEYSELRGGSYYVAGTRISLDSIVHAFRRGESPETIWQNFELLRLEEVYGAIAYYLANQAEIDSYLTLQSDRWSEGRRNAEPLPGDLRQRLMRARDETPHGSLAVKVRFLADADLNKAIVCGLLRREPCIDFMTAQAAGLRGKRDPEGLSLAAEERRALVSHDVNTMPTHFRAFRDGGRQSAGVLLVPQTLEIGTAIEELMLIWIASEASDWENRLQWLPL